MPLFMDRHDLPGATAEMVAKAHLSDLQTQARFDVQFLAYWFDAETGEVFCLAKAPRPEAMHAVHEAAHGLVPNEIITVSEDNVVRFLGRITDPSEHGPATSGFRTILFTDLEGSTAMLQEVGESAYMELLGENDLIIRRALLASHGREVKHTGDGIMAAFEEVARALECALAIEQGFASRNTAGERRELRIRVGMASGEPVDHNDDIFGATVNLASRICDAAKVGHPLVSEPLRDLGLAQGFSFDDGREVELKGFTGATRVFELLPRSG